MIGPRFSEELRTAGLAGLPFSWSSSGEIYYSLKITPEQKAAIEAVVAVHDPLLPATVVITPKDKAIDDILKLDSKTVTLESLVKLLQVALIPPPIPKPTVTSTALVVKEKIHE